MKPIKPILITDVNAQAAPKNKNVIFWENLQLFCLILTIIGQCVIGANFFFGQGLWLAANTITLIRDFKLKRPAADKIKNACLTGITLGLIVFWIIK